MSETRGTSGLAIGAVASAAAAVLHAAASGIHPDHVGLARIFIALAVAQLGAAVLAFVRSDRWACGSLLAVNAAAFAGWIVTRLVGISWIGGLQVAERPQAADTIAAVLAAVAVAAAASCAFGRSVTLSSRALANSIVLAGLLLVPGLADATTHEHASDEQGHATEVEHIAGGEHEHALTPTADDGTSTGDGTDTDAAALSAAGAGVGDDHGDHGDDDDGGGDHATGEPAAPTAAWPRPGDPSGAIDPALPIDLGGNPGVTPEQQAFAENLVAVTLRYLPQWADLDVVEAAGFRSIGDGATGHEHYIQPDWIDDDVWLDPNQPESLVFEPQPDGTKQLVSAMYMLPSGTPLEEVPDWGGDLMQWHVHGDLCFTDDPEAPQVAGLKPIGTSCRPPLVDGTLAPMIHVWIRPHECGPFAALDGIAGGQVPDGEAVLCDHAHGSH